MKKQKPSETPTPPDEPFDEVVEFDPYAPPDELGGDEPPPPRGKKGPPQREIAGANLDLDDGLDESAGPPPVRRKPFPKVAVAVAVLLAIGGGLLFYRSLARKKAVGAAVARAELDLRYDTADGYRKAAAMLAPFAADDPARAGPMRAFALGMLALDYGDAAAGEEAEKLLIDPERADPVPRWASLARAAVSLSRSEVANAITAAGRAPGDPYGDTLQGRSAFAAANLDAAIEPLHAAAAAEPPLPAALALHGDALRRAKRDGRAAQAAYARALSASGEHVHPRAAYGMAKLALAGQVPPADATGPLERLSADAAARPNERSRAALHLAALALKAGDAGRAKALLDGAGLDPVARDWAERAAALEADTGRTYRAVEGAPPSILSPSDDDPPEVPPIAIAPPPAPEPPKVAPAKAATAAKAPAKRAPTKATKKKAPAKKPVTKKPVRR